MSFTTLRRAAPSLAGALGAALLLAACALPAQQHQAVPASAPAIYLPAAARVIAIDAHDFAFSAPETIQGGLVTIALKNLGHEPHHAQLLRLKEGVTPEQFTAALQQNEAAAAALITAEGGPAVIGQGGTSEVTLDLRPGNYLLACFIPSPDGVPHLAKGMLKPLRVTEGVAAPPPSARDSFVMRDFSFTMPDRLPAGRSTYKVVNEGPQPHELVVGRLAPGKTVEDVRRFFAGPPADAPPFEPVGGMQGLEIGGAGFVTLDLRPGAYVAVCLIPDPASGQPHVHLGMIVGFTVG